DVLVGIPDREIGVAADRDRALARVKAVKLRGIRGGQRDEFWKIDAPLTDPFRKEKRRAYFEAGHAVRHFLERRISTVVHVSCGIVVTVAGVIGRENIEHAAHKALPDRLLVCLVAGWGAAHIFRALKTGAVEIVGGQEEILRAGLAVYLEPARLRQTDLL